MGSFWTNLGKGVQIAIVAIVLVIVGGLLLLGLTNFFGTRANQVSNNLYNTSPTHIQAVATDLTNDCSTLARTTNAGARALIGNQIENDLKDTEWSMVKPLLFPAVVTCVNNAMNTEVGQTP